MSLYDQPVFIKPEPSTMIGEELPIKVTIISTTDNSVFVVNDANVIIQGDICSIAGIRNGKNVEIICSLNKYLIIKEQQ
jgi:hypothetical protein